MNDRTKEWATKVCRYNWHSALSMGWPFPLLKYKYIFQIKHTEAITSNTTRKLLWFEITKMPIAVKNKFIVSFNIIFRTLSFPVIRVSERLCRNSEWAGSGKRKQTGVFRSNFFTPWRRKFYARSEALRGSRKCRFFAVVYFSIGTRRFPSRRVVIRPHAGRIILDMRAQIPANYGTVASTIIPSAIASRSPTGNSLGRVRRRSVPAEVRQQSESSADRRCADRWYCHPPRHAAVPRGAPFSYRCLSSFVIRPIIFY